MKYLSQPNGIFFKELKEKHSLAPSDYKLLLLKNKNRKKLRELIAEPETKGKEVGSSAYIPKSPYYFIRTKALQSEFYLPSIEREEQAIPILPTSFKNFNLSQGDILMSKDANIGEVAYLDQNLPNYMISQGLVRLKFLPSLTDYIFAFLKSDFFKSQIEFMVSKASTIRHAKDAWKDAMILFPHGEDCDRVILYISLLTRSLIRKERSIRLKSKKINRIIEEQLTSEQLSNSFNYRLPSFNDIKSYNRLDAAIYSEDYKSKVFLVDNYKFGSKDIDGQGFKLSRGQNLQISAIGKSTYSDEFKPGFYRLLLPKYLTVYGTVSKEEYIGNKHNLKVLERGDIIFGAEGFEKGRSMVILTKKLNEITNIHGMVLKSEEHNLTKSIFIRCYLSYLRELGLIDKYAVGGNGGSLAERYWNIIKFPNFPPTVQEEIKNLYYKETHDNIKDTDIFEFEDVDITLTEESGILNLSHQMSQVKDKLKNAINQIIMDEKVSLSFSF